jgi:hypothetical protein
MDYLQGYNIEETSFNNEFDLTERTLDEVVIRQNSYKNNCFIYDKSNSSKVYSTFILKKNSRSKIVCEISFYLSSETDKYLPRPTFKRVLIKSDTIDQSQSDDSVIIALNTSEIAITFWKLIGFLSSYNEVIDTGAFKDSYEVIDNSKFIVQFSSKNDAEKISDLVELIDASDLPSSAIESLTHKSRKKDLIGFFHLLKNTMINGKASLERYREKYSVRNGEEYIWHHFLKEHDWILGLNLDIRFIMEFLEEQRVGLEDSLGKGSPRTDLLGISDFTTLVELKHSNTNIFKETKSKGRANTWDFTTDFIEGVSQCLGQKFELEKIYEQKNFINNEGIRLDKQKTHSVDPKSILIIGNKKKEFPIDKGEDINNIKLDTLQRFRRNTRNIDIITFDELFERAFQIVFSDKLSNDWYKKSESQIFNN